MHCACLGIGTLCGVTAVLAWAYREIEVVVGAYPDQDILNATPLRPRKDLLQAGAYIVVLLRQKTP